jgi:uncharacterized protein (DUF362 family)
MRCKALRIGASVASFLVLISILVGCAAPNAAPTQVQASAKPLVAIVRGDNVDEMVEEALARIGGVRSLIRDGDRVVIKPNLTWLQEDKGFYPGITTDLRIVRALVEQIQGAVQCELTIAEGTPASAEHMFVALGYQKMANERKVGLVDVDKSPRVAVHIDGVAHDEYNLPIVTQEADVLIDVAVLKTHNMAGVTLGMKNLYGLLDNPKSRFHGEVHEVICDLSIARKPDLVLIDGIVGMEGQGPVNGDPIRRDLLIAGRDIVAVDAIGTALMGFEPRDVKHLRLAHERGLGEIDLEKIRVVGVPVAQARHPFKPAMQDAEVRIPASPAQLERLRELADQVEEARWGRGLVAHFGPASLAVDNDTYPRRQSKGFRAYVHRRREIRFSAPFLALHPEHRKAAEEELRRWIAEKLDAGAAE